MSFKYDIEKLTKIQIKYAYESDMKEIETEINNISNLITTSAYYNLPEAKVKEMEEKITSLNLELENLKTELILSQI